MGDLDGCLVRTDLRPSLAGLVDECRAFSLLAERVGVVTVVVGGNDERAIAVNVDLAGGGLRPSEVGVVVARARKHLDELLIVTDRGLSLASIQRLLRLAGELGDFGRLGRRGRKRRFLYCPRAIFRNTSTVR